MGLAGCHGASEDAPSVDGVHADAISEQRTTGAATARVHQDHAHARRRKVAPEAAHQLVHHARLSRAAGSGKAYDGRAVVLGEIVQPPPHLTQRLRQSGVLVRRFLEPADQARDRLAAVRRQAAQVVQRHLDPKVSAGLHDLADHSVQPERAAVLRAEDARHALAAQLGHLLLGDRATTAAIDANVPGALFAKPRLQIAEELHVPALVGRHCDGRGVFLHGGQNDFVDRTVVSEVDHFGPLRLQDPAHDVDRGVVSIEERGGGHDANPGTPGGRECCCLAHDSDSSARPRRSDAIRAST